MIASGLLNFRRFYALRLSIEGRSQVEIIPICGGLSGCFFTPLLL